MLESDKHDQDIKLKELKMIFMELFSSIKNAVNPKPFISITTFMGEAINPMIQQDAT